MIALSKPAAIGISRHLPIEPIVGSKASVLLGPSARNQRGAASCRSPSALLEDLNEVLGDRRIFRVGAEHEAREAVAVVMLLAFVGQIDPLVADGIAHDPHRI